MSLGTFADLAIIISACAMVILAISTRNSVNVMRKQESSAREEGILRIRPYLDVDRPDPKILVNEDRLTFRHYIVNVGISPGIIDSVKVVMNHESSLKRVSTPSEMAIFPGKERRRSDTFNRSAVIRENRQFSVEIEIDYHDLAGNNYRREYGYILYTKLLDAGNFEIIDHSIMKSTTT